MRQRRGRLSEASGTGDASPRAVRRRAIAALDDASPTRPACPTVVEAVESATRLRASRATGWPVTAWLSPAPARPAQAAAPRPRQGRARSSPAAARTSVPEADQVQRARVDTEVRARRRRGVGAARAAVGRVRPPGLGLAAARPQRPARLGARRHRPRRRPDPGLGRAGAGAAVAAAARRARRGRLARPCSPPIRYLGVARAVDTPDVGGFPVPTVLLLGGVVARRRCWRCCAACWSRRPRAPGRARPTGGCARRSPRSPTSWSSRRCGPSWRRTTTVREGLGRALK